jgi:hypothetical protein
MKYACVICGYDQLDTPQYDELDFPTFTVCSCCGFESGFDDDATAYPKNFDEYRLDWLGNGAVWFCEHKNPENWNMHTQLNNIGFYISEYDFIKLKETNKKRFKEKINGEIFEKDCRIQYLLPKIVPTRIKKFAEENKSKRGYHIIKSISSDISYFLIIISGFNQPNYSIYSYFETEGDKVKIYTQESYNSSDSNTYEVYQYKGIEKDNIKVIGNNMHEIKKNIN